jgi:transposase-like protein
LIEDYPKNFEEFLLRFQSEKDCLDYIQLLRWPKGFECPKCGGKEYWKTNRNLLHCCKCNHQSSIIAGTLFQDTRKPLQMWFTVMWLMMAQKTGVSARNLKDFMGFGSYQTIWGWLHKLRSVMVRPNRSLLNVKIEVDETYIGGKGEEIRGRGAENKELVVVAVEVGESTLGRVRLRCIPDASEESLLPFIVQTVQKGSIITTGGWNGYLNISKKGFVHDKKIINQSNETACELMPNVHKVISLVKRWLSGTHQGAVTPEHLQDYLNEFSFRFNRKLSNHRSKLFYRLMQEAVSRTAPPIKSFYHKEK